MVRERKRESGSWFESHWIDIEREKGNVDVGNNKNV